MYYCLVSYLVLLLSLYLALYVAFIFFCVVILIPISSSFFFSIVLASSFYLLLSSCFPYFFSLFCLLLLLNHFLFLHFASLSLSLVCTCCLVLSLLILAFVLSLSDLYPFSFAVSAPFFACSCICPSFLIVVASLVFLSFRPFICFFLIIVSCIVIPCRSSSFYCHCSLFSILSSFLSFCSSLCASSSLLLVPLLLRSFWICFFWFLPSVFLLPSSLAIVRFLLPRPVIYFLPVLPHVVAVA